MKKSFSKEGYYSQLPAQDGVGRVPPKAIDLEKAILGALLLESTAYSEVCMLLSPESFYQRQHQLIYQAIQDLNNANLPADMLTVTQRLREQDQLEESGGAAYISELSSNIVSSSHILYHAQIVHQKKLARDMISFGMEVVAEAYDESLDIDDVMNKAENKLTEITGINAKGSVQTITDALPVALTAIGSARNNANGLTGVSTGFSGIDRITNGWQDSDLIIIAARPSMGKTAFVLSMAKHIAIDHQVPLAFFSLEMSTNQLVKRLLSNIALIDGSKLTSGNLTQQEWDALDYKAKDAFGKPLYIDDTANISLFEFRTKARRLVRDKGVKCIIIDYLQLMSGDSRHNSSREQEVSSISRGLKQLAKELSVPIIALSQLNRGVENRVGIEGKRPQLADLRESGAIEQDADLVCFIHRPEYYHIEVDENGYSTKGMAEFIIAKQRNGAVGTISLRFKSETATFYDMDREPVKRKDFATESDDSEEEEIVPSAINCNAPF